MFMKGRVKLRIIQIYFHANTSNNRTEIEDVQNYVINLLNQASLSNYKVILMGDFNLNFEKFSLEYRSNRSLHWKYGILRELERLQYQDSIALYHDITVSNPFYTFHPRQSQLSASRIDAIWVSPNFIMDTLSSNNFTCHYFNTDHQAIKLSCITSGIFERKSFASLKQHDIKKRIFDYSKMDSDKWVSFQSEMDNNTSLQYLSDLDLQSQSDINRTWDIIQDVIINAAIHHIDNHESSFLPKQDIIPNEILEIKADINFLNRAIRKSSNNPYSYRSYLTKGWIYDRAVLQKIKDKHNISITLPVTLNTTNISILKKDLFLFRKNLCSLLDVKSKTNQDAAIKQFVRQR
ncbi:hypothetical protein C1645_839989, partial [Glomus cerebriforme]